MTSNIINDLRDYIAQADFDDYNPATVYCHRMPVGDIAVSEKLIGVYESTRSEYYKRALAGLDTYDVQYISVLIHWTRDPGESLNAARAVFDMIKNIRNVQSGDSVFLFCIPIYSAPVPVGTDQDGVCEYVVEAALYYNISK